jgi:Tol biopolymer transport system component
MTRKGLIILLAILVLAAFGLVAYILARKRITDLSPATLVPTQVLSHRISFPALSSDGASLVYFSDENPAQTGLFRVNLATKGTELFRSVPKGSAVGWSPDRKRAIISLFYDEQAVKGTRFERRDAFSGVVALWVYDIFADRLESLPIGIASTVWSLSGDKIYYHYFDLTQIDPISELAVREAFGVGHQKLADIPSASSYTMQFLNENSLLLVPKISDPDGATSLYVFDLKTKETSTFADNKVFAAYASPDGTHVLYESVGKKHSWYLFERSTGRDTDLRLLVDQSYAAWVDPDRFLVIEYRQDMTDRLWLVDTRGLTRQELTLKPANAVHVDRIYPTTKEIYFTSDGILYRVELP